MSDFPWDSIGLVRHPGQRDRFYATDNLTGWFEGFTHSQALGQGYMVRDAFVFTGWSTTVNARPVDRDFKAVTDTVFPWGNKVQYPGVTEELLLHSGRRVLSLRVTTQLPADIEITPRWAPKFPKGLKHTVVSVRTPDSLTMHLVFGETAAELAANRGAVEAPDAWEAQMQARWESLTETWFITDDDDYNSALFWAQASARSFVTNEFGTGIWAGLPWFKDNWGRDTFIALPGTLLVTGQFAQAKAVLENFARYQNLDKTDKNYGRIPNRVNRSEILYNTVDGTPWMIRELMEYARCTGDLQFALNNRPLIRRYVDGALKNFVDAHGLLTHDDADTWMDARIEGDTPWSPRGDRAVEIQVLWIQALEIGAELAHNAGDEVEASFFRSHADKAREAFLRLFALDETLADRLFADGTRDTRVRPNVLLTVTIPFEPLIPPSLRDSLVSSTTSKLLLPQGILSLDPAHADFHPHHENPVFWHKDAAYHNGTIWGWNAGFAVSALAACGWQDRGWQVTRNLADQILELGAMGTMSELIDAKPDDDGNLVPTGTFAQAWSVSEFVRNAWQDYLGFHPDLTQDRLVFEPRLPSDWTQVRARASLGSGRYLEISVSQTTAEDGTLTQEWTLTGTPAFPPVFLGGQQRQWSGKTIACEIVVAPPGAPPPFASIPDTAGTAVMAAGDVLKTKLLSR